MSTVIATELHEFGHYTKSSLEGAQTKNKPDTTMFLRRVQKSMLWKIALLSLDEPRIQNNSRCCLLGMRGVLGNVTVPFAFQVASCSWILLTNTVGVTAFVHSV